MPLPFPFRMHNAEAYASSSSTNFTKYEDLPGHHLLSIRNLIASSPDDSYPETASSIADDINFFMNNFTAEEADDYSGVRDLDPFRSFQLAAAYCLTCSEDSSEGIMTPLGSASWPSSRTGRTTTPRAMTERRGRRAGEPRGGACRDPFFFIKLGGAAGTAGATQGASSQARRAASVDTGAAHRT